VVKKIACEDVNAANQALLEAVGGESFNSTNPACMVVATKSTPAQLEQEKALNRKSFGSINEGIFKARRTITKHWKAINGAWDKIKSGWSNVKAVRKAFKQSRQTRINAAGAVRRAQKAQEANEKKLQDALNDNVATCTATGKAAHTCSAVCLEDNLGNCDQSQCSKCNICSLKAQLNAAKKTVNIKAKAVEEAAKDEANVEMQRINASKDQAKAEEATAADFGPLKTDYAKYVHEMRKTAVDALTNLEAGLKSTNAVVSRGQCASQPARWGDQRRKNLRKRQGAIAKAWKKLQRGQQNIARGFSRIAASRQKLQQSQHKFKQAYEKRLAAQKKEALSREVAKGKDAAYEAALVQGVASCSGKPLACPNQRSPWMIKTGKFCTTWKHLPEQCTQSNSQEDFMQNKYCQQSCFDADRGYNGDDCSSMASTTGDEVGEGALSVHKCENWCARYGDGTCDGCNGTPKTPWSKLCTWGKCKACQKCQKTPVKKAKRQGRVNPAWLAKLRAESEAAHVALQRAGEAAEKASRAEAAADAELSVCEEDAENEAKAADAGEELAQIERRQIGSRTCGDVCSDPTMTWKEKCDSHRGCDCAKSSLFCGCPEGFHNQTRSWTHRMTQSKCQTGNLHFEVVECACTAGDMTDSSCVHNNLQAGILSDIQITFVPDQQACPASCKPKLGKGSQEKVCENDECAKCPLCLAACVQDLPDISSFYSKTYLSDRGISQKKFLGSMCKDRGQGLEWFQSRLTICEPYMKTTFAMEVLNELKKEENQAASVQDASTGTHELMNAGLECRQECTTNLWNVKGKCEENKNYKGLKYFQQGFCPTGFCGTGFCCRKGWRDTTNGCNGSMGIEGKGHVCVAAPSNFDKKRQCATGLNKHEQQNWNPAPMKWSERIITNEEWASNGTDVFTDASLGGFYKERILDLLESEFNTIEVAANMGGMLSIGKNGVTTQKGNYLQAGGGTGKLNCCRNNCGPNSKYGSYPVLWDEEAVNPNGKGKGWTNYPARCEVSDLMPKDAHMLRVTPCGTEYQNVGVTCVLVKLTKTKNPSSGEPAVQGWTKVLPVSHTNFERTKYKINSGRNCDYKPLLEPAACSSVYGTDLQRRWWETDVYNAAPKGKWKAHGIEWDESMHQKENTASNCTAVAATIADGCKSKWMLENCIEFCANCYKVRCDSQAAIFYTKVKGATTWIRRKEMAIREAVASLRFEVATNVLGACTCTHGKPATGSACNVKKEKCTSCDSGYHLDNDKCMENVCTCAYGCDSKTCKYKAAYPKCDNESPDPATKCKTGTMWWNKRHPGSMFRDQCRFDRAQAVEQFVYMKAKGLHSKAAYSGDLKMLAEKAYGISIGIPDTSLTTVEIGQTGPANITLTSEYTRDYKGKWAVKFKTRIYNNKEIGYNMIKHAKHLVKNPGLFDMKGAKAKLEAEAEANHWAMMGSIDYRSEGKGGKPNQCVKDHQSAVSPEQSPQEGGKLGVTCCAGTTGTAADRPGCKKDLTFAQAEAHCKAHNKVLCSVQQIEDGAGKHKGCSFDKMLTWTRDQCSKGSSLANLNVPEVTIRQIRIAHAPRWGKTPGHQGWWTGNKFCRKSCFEHGAGYDGDICNIAVCNQNEGGKNYVGLKDNLALPASGTRCPASMLLA